MIMPLSPAAVEPKHKRDFINVIIPCDTVWKMEGGVNIIGIGPHGPSFAEYQVLKWLHMEGWRKMPRVGLFMRRNDQGGFLKNGVTTIG